MWDGNRADLKFDRFRERISVRQDRSEPAWNPRLDYNPRVEAVKTKYASHSIQIIQEHRLKPLPDPSKQRHSEQVPNPTEPTSRLRDVTVSRT